MSKANGLAQIVHVEKICDYVSEHLSLNIRFLGLWVPQPAYPRAQAMPGGCCRHLQHQPGQYSRDMELLLHPTTGCWFSYPVSVKSTGGNCAYCLQVAYLHHLDLPPIQKSMIFNFLSANITSNGSAAVHLFGVFCGSFCQGPTRRRAKNPVQWGIHSSTGLVWDSSSLGWVTPWTRGTRSWAWYLSAPICLFISRAQKISMFYWKWWRYSDKPNRSCNPMQGYSACQYLLWTQQ